MLAIPTLAMMAYSPHDADITFRINVKLYMDILYTFEGENLHGSAVYK